MRAEEQQEADRGDLRRKAEGERCLGSSQLSPCVEARSGSAPFPLLRPLRHHHPCRPRSPAPCRRPVPPGRAAGSAERRRLSASRPFSLSPSSSFCCALPLYRRLQPGRRGSGWAVLWGTTLMAVAGSTPRLPRRSASTTRIAATVTITPLSTAVPRPNPPAASSRSCRALPSCTPSDPADGSIVWQFGDPENSDFMAAWTAASSSTTISPCARSTRR